MVQKKNAYNIEYHPEFLYFNTFVRENKYTPAQHPEIWMHPLQYELFNYFLFGSELCANKSRKSWIQFCKEFFPHLPAIKNISKHVDIDQWVKYAKSINIEGMLDKYLPRIFKAFGTTFFIPKIKVSPVRLNPCPLNHFRALCSGSYSLYHLSKGDPPFYDPIKHLIYLPIPEQDTKLPFLALESILVHELLHSALRPFLYKGFKIGEFDVQIQSNIINIIFTEVFAHAGTYIILKESGDIPKQQLDDVFENFALSEDLLYIASFAFIKSLGLDYLASLLSPVFRVAQNMSFLSQEYTNIQTITDKKARGLLTKIYKYKKQVKGMDRKILKKHLTKHLKARIKAVTAEIASLDINKILKGAMVREEDPYKKQLLNSLCDIFDHKREEEWKKMLQGQS